MPGPNVNGFASQWNIGFIYPIFCEHWLSSLTADRKS